MHDGPHNTTRFSSESRKISPCPLDVGSFLTPVWVPLPETIVYACFQTIEIEDSTIKV